LSCYFPNNPDNPVWKLILNPFHTDLDSLPNPLQEQAIELKGDTSATDNFKSMNLEESWEQ
jgi:hypothetical protein